METLNQYKERAFINSLLCDLSKNYYSIIYNITLFPTIIGSSILTVLNLSDISQADMKIINIVINGINTIILTILSQYKLNDRIHNFKSLHGKFVKLNHKIESLINKNKKEEITSEMLEALIQEYDLLIDNNEYMYPSHIRLKVINKYGNKLTLPNSLEIDCSINIKTNTILTNDVTTST